MKFNTIKKILALSLCILMILTGCSQPTETSDKKNDNNNIEGQLEENENKEDIEEEFIIGISQLIQHPALDASKEGFVDELKNLGMNVVIDEQNAQGDLSNAQMIAEKFVKDDVDLIFTVATLTSQAAKKAVEGKDIPVVFTAVTDPVYSQLVTDLNVVENITGVTDAAPIKEDLELFLELKGDAKSIGIIYNIGETNSEIQVEQSTEIAVELGLTIEAVGIATVADIPQAMNTLSGKVDGLYLITDNMVASAIQLVANLAVENNLITVSADGGHVDEGIMMSKGISYYTIGQQSAKIAKQILVDKIDISEIPVQSSLEFEKKVNIETMEALGFSKDHKAFEGAEFVEQ